MTPNRVARREAWGMAPHMEATGDCVARFTAIAYAAYRFFNDKLIPKLSIKRNDVSRSG